MAEPVTVPADRSGTARAAARMGAATAVSRALGFVRIIVVAAVLGTTYLGNTFQASNSVSNVLFDLLAAGALSAVLVPTFVSLLERREQAEAERLAGSLLGAAILVLGAVTLAGEVLAPWIARLLSSGVTDRAVAAQQNALATFLLRWFIPQVVLYGVGAIAIALLYARRRFAITALAPIGNSVMIVAAMIAFRVMVGPGDTSLQLSLAEKLALALGGTLGVAAFVGIPVIALERSGFRLRPLRPRRDPALGRLIRLSAWAVFQHSAAGLLLGAAIIVGGAVQGGVVAYQVAFVVFLAPYAIFAQPVHTAILPDLSLEAERGDDVAFSRSVRWSLDAMATLVLPISAAMVAVALPAMRVVAFGNATEAGGVGLLAAATASLAVGLYPYSAFLLLARAGYAQHDSRTPALVGLLSACLGVVVMVAGASVTHGSALVAWLGLGHTVAYSIGALWLLIALRRRVGQPLVSWTVLRPAGVAGVLALLAWCVERAIAAQTRSGAALVVLGVLVLGGVLYLLVVRALGGAVRLRPGSPPVV